MKIELEGNYESFNDRDKIIKGKCKGENCTYKFSKSFRSLVDMGGPFCENCIKKKKISNFLNRKNIGNTYTKWLLLKNKVQCNYELNYFDKDKKKIEEKEVISSSYIQGKCEYNICEKLWLKKITDIFECENFFCDIHSKIIGLNKKIITQRKNLSIEDSFASTDKSKYWSIQNIDENGDFVDSRYIHKKSGVKFLFVCNICNTTFKKSCAKVSNGEWCGNCKNKTEHKLLEYLKNFYLVIHQYKQDWCKNKRHLPFDFCIEELKIIIELDGRQHFGKIETWTSLEDANKNDRYKMKCANENGFSVIRIVQENVWNDKYDWKKELLENIDKIKHEGKIQNIFMCKNGEYDIFC